MTDSRSRIGAVRVLTVRLLMLLPFALGSRSVTAQPNVLYIFPDGLIDVQDWIVYRDNFDGNLADLTFLDAYLRGDLDGDLDNDVDDFALFKNAFNEANGAGSFEEMLASVPEPSTVGLLMLGSLIVAVGSRSRRRKRA